MIGEMLQRKIGFVFSKHLHDLHVGRRIARPLVFKCWLLILELCVKRRGIHLERGRRTLLIGEIISESVRLAGLLEWLGLIDMGLLGLSRIAL